MEYVKLNNGIDMPVIGLGTYMISPKDAEITTRESLKMGYRMIDTANAYVNERAVGRGIKESGVPKRRSICKFKNMGKRIQQRKGNRQYT